MTSAAVPTDVEMLACAADACVGAGLGSGSVSGVTLRPPSGSRKRPCGNLAHAAAPAAKAAACAGAGAAAGAAWRCSAPAAPGGVSNQQNPAGGSAFAKARAHAAHGCSLSTTPVGCSGAPQDAACSTASPPGATGPATGAARDPAGSGSGSGLVAGLGWMDRGAVVARVTGMELRRARHTHTLLLRMQVRAHSGFFQASRQSLLYVTAMSSTVHSDSCVHSSVCCIPGSPTASPAAGPCVRHCNTL